MVVETRTTLISVTEFEQLNQQPGYTDQRLELIEGVIIAMSRPGWKHGNVVVRLATRFELFNEKHHVGYFSAESGYILFTNPDGRDTVVGPDIGFARLDRAPRGLPDTGYTPFPPDLAVEVVSPNDIAYELSEKVLLYLRAGTQQVWLVDPVLQTIIIHRTDGVTAYDRSGIIDGGELLPGFALPVRDIFPA